MHGRAAAQGPQRALGRHTLQPDGPRAARRSDSPERAAAAAWRAGRCPRKLWQLAGSVIGAQANA
jgi:hypothetical protein